MKKVLFATTALIATAGIASADVKIGGYGFAGATFAGNTTTAVSGMRLTFTGTVETDAGVTLSAFTRVTNTTPGSSPGTFGTAATATTAAVAGAPGSAIGGDLFARNRIDISAGGLKVSVGSTHGAMRNTARLLSYQGFNDGGIIGVDNGAGIGVQTDGGNNVYVEYKTGSFKVGASTTVAGGGATEIGAQYSANGFTVGVGADTQNRYMAFAKYATDTWNVGLGTNNANNIYLVAGYNVSSATDISFAVNAATGGTINAVGLTVGHDIGGATISGTVGQVAGATRAGVGIKFDF